MNFKMDYLGDNLSKLYQGEKSSQGDILETFLNFISKNSVNIKSHHFQESGNSSTPATWSLKSSVLEHSRTQSLVSVVCVAPFLLLRKGQEAVTEHSQLT